MPNNGVPILIADLSTGMHVIIMSVVLQARKKNTGHNSGTNAARDPTTLGLYPFAVKTQKMNREAVFRIVADTIKNFPVNKLTPKNCFIAAKLQLWNIAEHLKRKAVCKDRKYDAEKIQQIGGIIAKLCLLVNPTREDSEKHSACCKAIVYICRLNMERQY